MLRDYDLRGEVGNYVFGEVRIWWYWCDLGILGGVEGFYIGVVALY